MLGKVNSCTEVCRFNCNPKAVELAWVVCTFLGCFFLHVSPGTLASSNSSAKCTCGWSANLDSQSACEWFVYIWPDDKLATCLGDTLSSPQDRWNRLQCTHHPERGRDAGQQNGWMDLFIYIYSGWASIIVADTVVLHCFSHFSSFTLLAKQVCLTDPLSKVNEQWTTSIS